MEDYDQSNSPVHVSVTDTLTGTVGAATGIADPYYVSSFAVADDTIPLNEASSFADFMDLLFFYDVLGDPILSGTVEVTAGYYISGVEAGVEFDIGGGNGLFDSDGASVVGGGDGGTLFATITGDLSLGIGIHLRTDASAYYSVPGTSIAQAAITSITVNGEHVEIPETPEIPQVPEPSSWLLAILGGIGVARAVSSRRRLVHCH